MTHVDFCRSLYAVGLPSDAPFICFHIGEFIGGLAYTLRLTAAVVASGLLVGLFVAGARLSPWRSVSAVTAAYTELFRNTPVLVQLIWVFYALPVIVGVTLSPFASVALALTMTAGAYYGEAFRTGIQGVSRDQIESADVLGLSYLQKMRLVVLPQALRIVAPVVLSTSITLFKETSLVHWLGIDDLMGVSKALASKYYIFSASYTTAAFLYFIIAAPAAFLVRKLELRMAKALER